MVTLIDEPLITAYLRPGNVWILCGGTQLSCGTYIYGSFALFSVSSMDTELRKLMHKSPLGLIFS